jgi:hypothetical protein
MVGRPFDSREIRLGAVRTSANISAELLPRSKNFLNGDRRGCADESDVFCDMSRFGNRDSSLQDIPTT